MRFTCWRGMLAGAIAWAVMAGAASASAGEEVRLEVGGVTLAGSLVLPEGAPPRAAVVMLAGSGPNGRDGHVRGFPAYRVIAEHLAGQGVAVLLLDRRGVGGSGGDWRRETIPGRARDAVAAADFLRRRLPGPPVGLVGHSQGGWVALEAAAAPGAAVDFVVLMAGPGESVREQIVTDDSNQLRLAGATPEAVERRARRLRLALRAATAVAPLCRAARLHLLCFVVDYDPAPTLPRVRAPVLALFGERDSLVPPQPNLARLSAGLPDGQLTARVFAGANHQFWPARTGAMAEYRDLTPGYVPGFLEAMSDWIVSQAEGDVVAVAEQGGRGL